MEHFHWAGGVPRLVHELADLLDLDARDVTGSRCASVLAALDTLDGRT